MKKKIDPKIDTEKRKEKRIVFSHEGAKSTKKNKYYELLSQDRFTSFRKHFIDKLSLCNMLICIVP